MKKLDTKKADPSTVCRSEEAIRRGTDYTTVPVKASPAAEPEFVDIPGLQARFGIRRSLAYLLIADGAIKSVSLRRRGALKGKRLFDVASVRQFLKANTR